MDEDRSRTVNSCSGCTKNRIYPAQRSTVGELFLDMLPASLNRSNLMGQHIHSLRVILVMYVKNVLEYSSVRIPVTTSLLDDTQSIVLQHSEQSGRAKLLLAPTPKYLYRG